MRTAIITAMLIGYIAPALRAADPLDSLALVYDDGMGNTLPYRLFLPPGFDEPGAEFPLVLFLHGSGEGGDNNTAQVTSYIDGLIDATQGDRFTSFLLAPQAPIGQGWSGGGDQLSQSMRLTTEIIAELESQYQIDATRRYVTGLSMGGFGTFDVIAKRPDMFAAALPLSGGGNPSLAADMADVPLWVAHGHTDGSVLPAWSRNMIEALIDIGSDPIYLEEIGSHNIWDRVYSDAHDDYYPWLFEGVEPSLATLVYNSVTGNVKVDATRAPDGLIEVFRIRTHEAFNLTGDIEIDGVIVTQFNDSNLTYDGRAAGGFSSVAELGNILPTGLDLNSLADGFHQFFYLSPATGSGQRNFRFQIVVPEPTAIVLFSLGLTLVATHRRRPAR